MTIRVGQMRASGLIAGLIVLVLGALMMADAVVAWLQTLLSCLLKT